MRERHRRRTGQVAEALPTGHRVLVGPADEHLRELHATSSSTRPSVLVASRRGSCASAAAGSSTTWRAASCADQPASTKLRMTLRRRTASSS